jgi:hypothetical protein
VSSSKMQFFGVASRVERTQGKWGRNVTTKRALKNAPYLSNDQDGLSKGRARYRGVEFWKAIQLCMVPRSRY